MKNNLLTENTNFRRLFGAGVCSNFADGLMLVALPWLATLVTSDPLLISLVFASNRLSWVLLFISAGLFADLFYRWLLGGRMGILEWEVVREGEGVDLGGGASSKKKKETSMVTL